MRECWCNILISASPVASLSRADISAPRAARGGASSRFSYVSRLLDVPGAFCRFPFKGLWSLVPRQLSRSRAAERAPRRPRAPHTAVSAHTAPAAPPPPASPRAAGARERGPTGLVGGARRAQEGGARCEDRRAAPVRRPAAAAPPAPPLELITHLSLSVLYSALFRGRCVIFIPRAY